MVQEDDRTLSPLEALAPLLRAHPELGSVLGRTNATLAVPAAARPLVLGGLAHLSGLRPFLVVTPTLADAEHLAEDLRCFLEPGTVEVFAPWETLPLERVSPDVHTMGTRLSVLWRLVGDEVLPGDPGLRVVVAPVRAVLQRLGPVDDAARPLVVSRGARLEQAELLARLVDLGYRREHQVEHRGEFAVRGGIVDVFASTAEEPFRLDLFGDEVDRLSAFDVGDQRSTAELEQAVVFSCRELVLTGAIRDRARALADSSSFGRGQWERLAEGE